MGVLRLSLALMVLYVHLQLRDDAYLGVGPVIAVEAFFVVSGFYMAMILGGPYRRLPIRSFYANRALRLLPTHLVVLLISVVLALFLAPTPLMLSGFVRLDQWPSLFDQPTLYPLAAIMTLMNVFILGIHALHFGCFDTTTGSISLVDGEGSCHNGINMLEFTPNPPLWTLSIEMLFYLCAPFLVYRKNRTLVILICLALIGRLGLYALGYTQIPWNRTLFVLESTYFILGILAYRVYLSTLKVRIPQLGLATACLLFIALSYGFRLIVEPLGYRPGDPGIIGWVYILMLTALVPLFFRWSSTSRIDRFIGDLAYPSYISHVLVLSMFQAYGGERLRVLLGSEGAWIAANVIGTLVFSFLCLKLVIEPTEGLRARIRRGEPTDSPRSKTPAGAAGGVTGR